MLYLYFLLYIVYLIIYRENKTVGVFLIGVRSSWCWWWISPDGGRVPHRCAFLLVLVGDKYRRWACSSSVGVPPGVGGR